MLFVVAAIIGMVLGIAVGGRLSNFLDFKINKSWLILTAFAAITIARVFALRYPEVGDYSIIIHVLIYGLLLFCIWHNRHYFGIWFLGAGCLMNAAVMLVNNGKMPVSAKAALQAGMALDSVNLDMKHILYHSAEEIRLWFLSDAIHVPGILGRGMQIISIGDLIMVLGVILLILQVVRGKNQGHV